MLQKTSAYTLKAITNRRPLLFHASGVFLMSITITLLFWTSLPPAFQQSEPTDYLVYYEPVARQILNGAGIVRSNSIPAINNPPGYPILLAGVLALAQVFELPENLMHSLFVLFCIGLSSVFVLLLSEKIWGMRGGWFSALFFMSYPFVLWLTKQPNSEVPFMAAFYASLFIFWFGLKGHKNTWILLLFAGIFAGAAMLIRAIAIGIGILLFGLFLALKKNIHLKRRFLLASIILLGNFLAVLPWQVWVYGQTGQVVLLATNGVFGIRDGLTFAVELKNYRQKIAIPADVANLQNQFAAENASMSSFGEILNTLGKHFVKEPMAVVKLFLIKAGRSWYGTDSGSLESAILIIQLFYGVLVLFASAAVWIRRSELPGLLLFVWGFVIYFWIMTTLALSILRYMTPVIGLLSLLIPGLVDILLRRFSPSHSK